jgi:hypothetical protein
MNQAAGDAPVYLVPFAFVSLLLLPGLPGGFYQAFPLGVLSSAILLALLPCRLLPLLTPAYLASWLAALGGHAGPGLGLLYGLAAGPVAALSFRLARSGQLLSTMFTVSVLAAAALAPAAPLAAAAASTLLHAWLAARLATSGGERCLHTAPGALRTALASRPALAAMAAAAAADLVYMYGFLGALGHGAVGLAALLAPSTAAGLALSLRDRRLRRLAAATAALSAAALAAAGHTALALLGAANGVYNAVNGYIVASHGRRRGDPAAMAYASHLTRNLGGFAGALLHH